MRNLHPLAAADNIAEACRITAFNANRRIRLLTNPNQQSKRRAINNADTCRSNGSEDCGHPARPTFLELADFSLVLKSSINHIFSCQ